MKIKCECQGNLGFRCKCFKNVTTVSPDIQVIENHQHSIRVDLRNLIILILLLSELVFTRKGLNPPLRTLILPLLDGDIYIIYKKIDKKAPNKSAGIWVGQNVHFVFSVQWLS